MATAAQARARVKKLITPEEFNEIQKCRRSPFYFLATYGFIRDPVCGRIKFNPYRFQQIVLSKFLEKAFSIILKARQMGLSWLVAGFALWYCLFFEDKKVLIISIKDETAKAFLKKVRFIYKNLPEFLQSELVDDNMSRMGFANGSEVQSVPTSEEAGRSESLSLLIIDEAAYVRWMGNIWQAAYPTLSTGGSAIVLSTPNGMGNFYYDLWEKSVEGRSLFNPIRLHWYFYPGRDAKWLEIQSANMDPMQLAQEIMGDFIASGNLVFDMQALRALQDECQMIEPISMLYTEEKNMTGACGLYIYENPDPQTDYILSIDCAKGGAGDFHGAHIIKRLTGKQVAEYRTKVPLEVFIRRAFALGEMYNYALAGIENNNMGIAAILHFRDKLYPRMYEYANPLKPGTKDLGFPTNTLTRPILIDELGNCIREGVSGIQGLRTVNEFMNFAWSKKGKAEAMEGKNDDLVMAYGIGRYIRKTMPFEIDLPYVVA